MCVCVCVCVCVSVCVCVCVYMRSHILNSYTKHFVDDRPISQLMENVE